MAGGDGHSKTTKRAFEDDGLPSPSSGGRERGVGGFFVQKHPQTSMISKIISLSPSPSLLSLPDLQPRNITASYSYTNQKKPLYGNPSWGGGEVCDDGFDQGVPHLGCKYLWCFGGGEEEWVHEYECCMRKLAEVVNRGLCMVKRGPNKAV